MHYFSSHGWPGNVRELEHAIEAAMNLINHEDIIEYHHLPYQYRKMQREQAPKIIVAPATYEGELTEQLTLFEKQVIEQAVMRQSGHITNAAKQLGLSRQSLQYRMKRLNIKV